MANNAKAMTASDERRGGYVERKSIMIANVGGIDRGLRIAVGIVLIAATATGVIGAWGWLGVIPLATGLFRFCPAYLPFGVSSCGTRGNAS